MRIFDFENLIRELPYKNQSFKINKENWLNTEQKNIIDSYFKKDNNSITLNRFDLFKCNLNTKELIIKTLMWGYPTKGRGNNIINILKEDEFKKLIEILENYRNENIQFQDFKKDIKNVNGLGLSTMTKFTYFLNTKMNGNKAVIFDNKIQAVLKDKVFKELNGFEKMSSHNSINHYEKYIMSVNEIANKMKVQPDQIEYFLFLFGRNLSENNSKI